MTLDFSLAPTSWLLPLLLLSLSVVLVCVRTATRRLRLHDDPVRIGLLILAAGAALAVSAEVAIELWLVRAAP